MADPKLAFALKATNEATPTLNKVAGDLDRVGDKADGAGGKMGKLGGLMGGALKAGILAGGAAIAGAGFAVLKFGGEFDAAFDKIRVGTGATGEALDSLEADFKSVLTSIPTNTEDASTAIADLNTRLGLTGEPLRDMSKQIFELSRITDTDLGTNVEKVTRLFGDWGIETENQSEALDNVFKASQATGPSVDKLSSLMVSFGAPLRSLNFSMEESAALLGKWEKEGVNTELVMGSLKIAIAGFAKEGIDARDGLEQTIAKIQELGPGAEATGIAMKTFGARAGGDMAAAILEGKFAIDELVDTIASSEETITGVSAETMSFGEQWTIMKNNILVGVQPVLTKLFDLLGTGMSWLRTTGVPALKEFFGALKSGDATGLATAGVLGGIVKVAFDIRRVLVEDVIPALKTLGAFLVEDVVPHLVDLGEVLVSVGRGVIEEIVLPALVTLRQGWEDIEPAVTALVALFNEHVAPALEKIAAFLLEHKEIIVGLALVILLLTNPWLAVVAVLAVVLAKWDEIKKMLTVTIPEAIDDVIESVERIPIIVEIFGLALDAVVLVVTTQFAVIRNIVETVLGAIINFVQVWIAIFKGDWDEAWTEIQELFKGIFDGMLTHVTIVLGSIVDLFLLFPGRIVGVLGDLTTLLLDVGTDILEGLWTGVSRYWDDVLQLYFLGIPKLIQDTVLTFGTDFLIDVGKAIIAGLKRGAEEAWQSALGFFQSIPGKIADAIKAPFSIFSPSKVTEGWGRDIIAGLGVGFIAGAAPMLSTLHAVIDVLKRDALGLVTDLTAELMAAWGQISPDGPFSASPDQVTYWPGGRPSSAVGGRPFSASPDQVTYWPGARPVENGTRILQINAPNAVLIDEAGVRRAAEILWPAFADQWRTSGGYGGGG